MMNNEIRKTALLTVSLAGVATAGFILFRGPDWVFSLWMGVLWGLGNLWFLARAAQSVFAGSRGWRLAGWIALKFIGWYGLLVWLLMGLHVSVSGWLVGFTLSLIGLGLSGLPSLQAIGRSLPALLLFSWAGVASASEAAQGESAHLPEIPNLITLMTHWGHGPFFHFLHRWEDPLFAFGIVGLVGGAVTLGARSLAMIPARGQIAVEAVVEGLDNFVSGILGRTEGRRYLPFVGTLFLFILSMNLAGLVPGLKSPTSKITMTGAMALCVFCYVQWTAVRRLGFLGYLDHLIGQPRDFMSWMLAPLMFMIHGIGEIVKPISLAARLFGNIMAEDILLGVFVMLGVLLLKWSHLPIGVPLHFPFMLMALIFSFVQALVFASLATIYILMVLPHEAHESHGSGEAALGRGTH